MTDHFALAFRNVFMGFKGQRLFGPISLEVAPGRVIGIRGPSGSGKSTLLKLAAGLLRPAAGCVTVNASVLGYVFQEPRLLPWCTALENVSLALEAGGLGKKKARERATQSLSDMDLFPFIHHYPGQLSGGMNQRVSIARALAVTPDLLILDEPFTGLDPALKERVRDLINAHVEKSRATVLHVTHSVRELMSGTGALYTLAPVDNKAVLTLEGKNRNGWGKS